MPKVTVGMPTYNRCATLRETIPQVLAQTFTDFEFLIYSDGATDDTAAVVRSFSDPRITFIEDVNKGIPHPLNGLLVHATGEYIIILHDHDLFEPDMLAQAVAALDRYPTAGFVLQGSGWVDEDDLTKRQSMLLDLPELNDGQMFGRAMLLQPNSFSSQIHACCLVRRSAYDAVGKYYDAKFGFYSDIDLWLRLLARYDFVYLRYEWMWFRMREAVGHVMNKRQFDITQWLSATFEQDALLFFDNPNDLAACQALTARKTLRDNLRTTIQFGTQREAQLFEKGLRLVSQSPSVGWGSRTICQLLLSSNGLRSVVMWALQGVNRIRKARA